MQSDEMGLVGRLRNEALERELSTDARPLLSEAAAAIERLVAEVARCHARLEIDHYFKIGDNDDQDLERVEIPMDERESFPDGIAARDATIALLEEELAAARQALGDT